MMLKPAMIKDHNGNAWNNPNICQQCHDYRKGDFPFFWKLINTRANDCKTHFLLKFLEDHSDKWSKCNITLGPMTEDRLFIFLWQWSPHFQLQ